MADFDFDALPGTETVRLVSGQPFDKHLIGIVFKRACRITPGGLCVYTDEPLPLHDDLEPWEECQPPLASSPRWDTDLFAFKPATDLVIQGHVHAYVPKPIQEAEIRVGSTRRTLRAHGDRNIEWNEGRPTFTPPESFLALPLRYERAYGGVDGVALAREGDPLIQAFQTALPSRADAVARNTEFHYPRNPSGCGYLMVADRESLESARVPNFEYPFDPITPTRLAVGQPSGWLGAPLPAGFDWYAPSWFPRLAYLGLVPEHSLPPSRILESEQGWAPPDILDLSRGKFPFFDLRYQQGASPGLVIPNLQPDAELELINLFPNAPVRRLRLPGILPKVRIAVGHSDLRDARARLSTVLVLPDLDRIELTFSACLEVSRWYANHELAAMKWSIG